MDDLAASLQQVIDDPLEDPTTRKMAGEILHRWNAGIVPSPGQLYRLEKARREYLPCGRIELDGTCGWLRKNYWLDHLPQPEPGQKIACQRVLCGPMNRTYMGCEGYRKPAGGLREVSEQ